MADKKDTKKVTKSDKSRKSLISSRKVSTKIKPKVDDTVCKSGSKRKASEDVMVPNIKKKMFEDVVELNVGGKTMTTLLTTLKTEPDSLLATMFSGRDEISKDKDGRYFIDLDGEVFKYILDFLRYGRLPSQEKALEVYDIAKYLQLVQLQKELGIFHSVKYQNQIANLRKQVDLNKYGAVKQESIKKIEESNIGPQENKILHFYNGDNCCQPDKDNCETIGDFTVSVNIFINTESTYLTEEMMALLAHELYEQDYAKYTVTRNYNKRCKKCISKSELKQIILLTH